MVIHITAMVKKVVTATLLPPLILNQQPELTNDNK